MEERNHQVIFVVVVAFCCWQKANPWRRFSSKGQNTGGVLVLLCVLALLCFTWFWLLFVTIPFLAQSLVHSRPLFCCTPSLPWRCFSSIQTQFLFRDWKGQRRGSCARISKSGRFSPAPPLLGPHPPTHSLPPNPHTSTPAPTAKHSLGNQSWLFWEVFTDLLGCNPEGVLLFWL